ncbi:hypothetical protein [Bosea sp. ANAM02]|uniref:hypothetical protein n=1 Tax=Bosea sp. ANAM02 TaxID=2020412 RepID=UPI00140F111B|nr:hypothetical protein [Bosea sp. ANAM02]BCB20281.1 hypothetical protein OCUBac02_31750 [Bosea sp. ANAM02]
MALRLTEARLDRLAEALAEHIARREPPKLPDIKIAAIPAGRFLASETGRSKTLSQAEAEAQFGIAPVDPVHPVIPNWSPPIAPAEPDGPQPGDPGYSRALHDPAFRSRYNLDDD